jgi:hypothetical protein
METGDKTAQAALKLTLRQLDDLIQSHWDQAREGNLKSTDTVLSILDRRTRLLGLDAPTKSASVVMFQGQDLMNLTVDELTEQAARLGIEYKETEKVPDEIGFHGDEERAEPLPMGQPQILSDAIEGQQCHNN